MFLPNPWTIHNLDTAHCCITCGKLFHQGATVAYTNIHGMTIYPHPNVPLTPTIPCKGGSS